MYVENIFTLELNTSSGIKYMVAAQAHAKRNGRLISGKNVSVFYLIGDGIMNPWGFGTLDKIRYFYDKERYLKNHIPTPSRFNKYKSLTGSVNQKVSEISFYKFCDMVTESLKNPISPDSLFGSKPIVGVKFTINGREDCFSSITLDVALKKCLEFQQKSPELQEIWFESNIVTKDQRKEMEKGFYLIKINKQDSDGLISYAKEIKGGRIIRTPFIVLSKQLKTENEAFRYIEKHESLFGEHGYEIIEVDGISLEKGFDVRNIPTI